MRLLMTGLLCLFAATHTAHAQTAGLDQAPLGQPPAGFTAALTGKGGPPKWVVEKAPGNELGNVIAQRSAEAIDYRYPILIYDGITASELAVSVKFRAVSGKVDQAAGLIWRYKDANNYYIVRANALENNVVLYKVEKGERIDLPVKGKGRSYGASAPVLKGQWNTLAVEAAGNTFTVSLNGQTLYQVEDETFRAAGKTGL
jgi:hypothetical protein